MSKTDFDELVFLFERTHDELQKRAARSVDTALVVRNWLFGFYLVECEGAGASRAELYGKGLVKRLSGSLAARGLRGVSPTNLRKCRAFYETYLELQPAELVGKSSVGPMSKIQQALPVESLATSPVGAAIARVSELLGTPRHEGLFA